MKILPLLTLPALLLCARLPLFTGTPDPERPVSFQKTARPLAPPADVLTVSAGPDALVCAGSPVFLFASAGGGTGNYSFSWSPAAGLSDPDAANPVALPSVTTTYVLTVTDDAGNEGSDTLTVTVDRPSGNITSGGNQSICAGDSVQLAVQTDPSNSVVWSTGQTGPSIWVQNEDTYTALITSPLGCTESADNDITITHLSLPSIPLIEASGPLQFCEGESVTLSARTLEDGIRFTWNTGEVSPFIKATHPGTYSLIATDEITGCATPSPLVDVTVWPLPYGSMRTSGATRFCPGDSLYLEVQAPPGTTWVWNTGGTSPGIWVKEAGNWSALLTSANGCTNAADNAVTTYLYPAPTLTVTQQGNLLTALPASGQFQWSLNGTPLSGTTPSLVLTQGGMYQVTRTGDHGCVAQTSITAVLQNVHSSYSWQVYPNPVQNDLTVAYNLRSKEKVSIVLLDALGQQVLTLASEERQDAGEHRYLVPSAGQRFQKGTYYLQLRIGDHKELRKLLIL